MPEQTDRERLEALAQQYRQERDQATAKQRQEQTEAAAARKEAVADADAKRDEFYEWAKATFSGFRLPETGTEVFVAKDGYYVYLNANAWLTTETTYEGAFALVRVQPTAQHGYEVTHGDVINTLPTLTAAKERVVEIIARMGRAELTWLLKNADMGARMRR